MNEPISGFLAAKKLAIIFAAAFGSLLSLKFIKRDSNKKGFALFLDNALLLAGGFGFSVFVAPVAYDYFALNHNAQLAVSFGFGMFGMSVAYQVNERLTPIFDVLQSAFERSVGHKDDGGAP